MYVFEDFRHPLHVASLHCSEGTSLLVHTHAASQLFAVIQACCGSSQAVSTASPSNEGGPNRVVRSVEKGIINSLGFTNSS